jgi:hypothetical protein
VAHCDGIQPDTAQFARGSLTSEGAKNDVRRRLPAAPGFPGARRTSGLISSVMLRIGNRERCAKRDSGVQGLRTAPALSAQ